MKKLLLLIALVSCSTVQNNENESTPPRPLTIQGKILAEALTDSKSRIGSTANLSKYESSSTRTASTLTTYISTEIFINSTQMKEVTANVFNGTLGLAPNSTVFQNELTKKSGSTYALQEFNTSGVSFEDFSGNPITDLNGYNIILKATSDITDEWNYLNPVWTSLGLAGIESYFLIKFQGNKLYRLPIQVKSTATTPTFIADINSSDPAIIFTRE